MSPHLIPNQPVLQPGMSGHFGGEYQDNFEEANQLFLEDSEILPTTNSDAFAPFQEPGDNVNE